LQRRTIKITTNLEPVIYEALNLLLSRDGVAAASYIRRLIVDDLENRGLLTEKMLASMAK
jgi:hypothetical protein